MPGFQINRVQTEEQLNAVYRLTHDQYVAEGYSQPQKDGMLRHYRRYDQIPETTIYTVHDGDRLVGTVSLTTSNLSGFPCEQDFPEEVAKIKLASLVMGRNVANCWRLVTDRKTTNLYTVLHLMNVAIEDCAQNKVNEILFVVNPKHVSVYQKLLGMRIIAEHQVEQVRAPGVLLYADGRFLASKWVDLCERKNFPTKATVRDFWWPTANAGKRRRWFGLF